MDRISELKGYFLEADIHGMVKELNSPFVDIRRKAHDHLVAIGKDAIPVLVSILHDSDPRMGCKAAQILADLEIPDGPRKLVKLLESAEPLVRWDSTKALMHLDRGAVAPILEALVNCYTSTRFRDGARDIFWMLAQSHRLEPAEERVLAVLEGPYRDVQAAEAAQVALRALKETGCLE